jgi:uncharacterized peroxidase-related enzyme
MEFGLSMKALNALAQVLLVDQPFTSRAERETMHLCFFTNQCRFCMTTHGAIAAHLPGSNQETMEAVWADYRSAPISEKLKALLHIAEQVAVSGRNVKEEDIAAARAQGASDMDIHDTVLIAATFCMFNRYVDGLGATTPDDPLFYELVGAQRAKEGYLTKSFLVKE